MIIIKQFRDVEKYADKLSEIKVWVCCNACGKTFLCKNDERFFDLDTYRGTMKNKIAFRDELSIHKMYEMLDEGKVILNAPHEYFLRYLDENHIPFVLTYGKPEVEQEYLERMIKRGSDEEFIKTHGHLVSTLYFDRSTDERPTIKIEMGKGEFLTDYLVKVFGLPQYFNENKGIQLKISE